MIKLLIDTSIPNLDAAFSEHFQITRYLPHDDIAKMLFDKDVLVCRSYTKVSEDMLKDSKLKLIATASSGSEHLNVKSIPLIDAKGSNAAAVCDYICSIFAALNIQSNQTVGVVGYGHVGQNICNRLHMLGYTFKVYDPFVHIPKHIQTNIENIMKSQVILIHPNYHLLQPFPTHHLINQNFIQQMSNETILINASRGKVVDDKALLSSNWHGVFCTDVYHDEPFVNPEIIQRAHICTPHIAGHSLEAKLRITDLISRKIHHFFNLPYIKQDFEHQIKIQKNLWMPEILQYYNPMIETKALKNNYSQEHFIQMRTMHQRHEFEFI